MDSSSDKAVSKTPGINTKSRTLIAVTELKKREHDLRKQIENYSREKNALQEIVDSLLEEEKILQKRVDLAKKNKNRVVAEEDSVNQRNMEILEQVEKYKREIAVFERRCQENEDREKDLDSQISKAEKELLAQKRQISFVTNELETGRETLARMDRKIANTRTRP